MQEAIDLFRSEAYLEEWRAAHEAAEEAISEVETEISDRHADERSALERRLADLKGRADDRLAELQRAARERAEAIARLAQEHFPEPLGNLEDLAQEAEELAAEATISCAQSRKSWKARRQALTISTGQIQTKDLKIRFSIRPAIMSPKLTATKSTRESGRRQKSAS